MGRNPKFDKIVEWSIEQIRNGKYSPGERFCSENELSDFFSLSRQTVRYAMSILEEQKYIRKVRGSGTYICDNLPCINPKTMNIGVISTYFDDYIFPGIIRGIEDVLSANGYAMQFAMTNNKATRECRTLTHLLKTGVDGLIIEPTKSGLPNRNIKMYEDINVPVVFFNSDYPSLTYPYISLNDVEAGHIAVKHLFNRGHKRIAGIFLHNDLQGHRRYLGYLNAHYEMKIDADDENVIWYSTEDLQSLFRNSERILARIGDCTAVLCYNDQLAVRFIEMLRANGIRVPDDISVIGIDNSELSAMCDPPLTTIAHPLDRLGRCAAETLISMINGQKGQSILFDASLIERKSVLQK